MYFFTIVLSKFNFWHSQTVVKQEGPKCGIHDMPIIGPLRAPSVVGILKRNT